MAVTRMSQSSIRDFEKTNSMAVGFYSFPLLTEYLVIAGGAGGGGTGGDGPGGGGGAGGYRSSVFGESSGGGASAEPLLSVSTGTYSVIVGAGGSVAGNGNASTFGSISCVGGGRGAYLNTGTAGGSGGGGMGSGGLRAGGAGTSGQGFAGGSGNTDEATFRSSGGGGGAGGAGVNGSPQTGGTGAGVASSISGSSVTRAVGGTVGSSASGGANTGTGGGSTGAGGSGLIIFRIPKSAAISFSGGVTSSVSTVGLYKIVTITATSTTSETVTIS